MKLLVHSINYAPELTGIGKFTGEMGSWFAERGHDVHVITTPPYYPEWRVRDGYTHRHYTTEIVDGAKVIRCPLWVPSRLSGVRRILHLFSFVLSSLPVLMWQCLVWRPEVVCIIKPPAFSLPFGLIGALIGGARSWVHIQDFDIDAAQGMGLIGGVKRWIVAFSLENWLLRRFNLATTISERMLEKLWDKGIAPEATALFPNWADIDAIAPLNRPSAFRKRLGIAPDTLVGLYAGNMGEKQGLENLIEAARELQGAEGIHIVICGDGVVRRRLEEQATALPNVTLLPLQPVEELNELLNLADVHLLPQRADAADLVMPSKLGGMLASGRPVIAGAVEGTQITRAVAGAGVVVPPDDGKAIAGALRGLAETPELRAEMGREARERAFEDWHRPRILTWLEARLSLLADARTRRLEVRL